MSVSDNFSASLNVVDLRKSFPSPAGESVEVLCGVSLNVQAGEAIAVTGSSGSGKSTLLHLLGGLDEPDHGSISFAGREVSSLRPATMSIFRQRHIGFVFQFHYLMTDLSAVENVALPLLITRFNTTEARRKARDLLVEFGLGNRADYPVTQLAGGEQQRVAVARALVGSPNLLIADEPTGNLDDSIGQDIGRILVNYARNQKRIAIIATHNQKLAAICDRVMLLQNGRLHVV